MGTRSLTHVTDESGKTIITMYRQYDGYPEGLGMELAELLDGMKIVNGFTSEDAKSKSANGMGCLAAQIVTNFKDQIGNVYLYPPKTNDCGEEYVYTVYLDGRGSIPSNKTLKLRCYDVWDKKEIFDGLPSDFKEQFKDKISA